MCDTSSLQDTKTIIRSLLLSTSEKVTIQQLDYDYRQMEGKHIPYSDLGFARLDQFLMSLTDTVEVS